MDGEEMFTALRLGVLGAVADGDQFQQARALGLKTQAAVSQLGRRQPRGLEPLLLLALAELPERTRRRVIRAAAARLASIRAESPRPAGEAAP